jgi:uncharacterized membrane protein
MAWSRYLSPTGSQSRALGVSGDGSIIVGMTRVDNGGGAQAARWTVMYALQPLERFQTAQAASFDGAVIAGYDGLAIRWTPLSGPVIIGDLPGGPGFTIAYDVSNDGNRIVGVGQAANLHLEAFYWSPEAL